MSEIKKVESGICLSELARLPDAALLDDKALGRALGVHPRTVRRMVMRGELPPGIRQAGKTLWLAGKVRLWIQDRAEEAERQAKREKMRLAKFPS